MDMKILLGLVRGLTCGWCLDTGFLVNILEYHNLDIEEILESIEMNFGKEYKCDFNYIMYETLSTIAYKFLEEYKYLFPNENSKEFEIFTNYMDSYIWFNNEDIQRKFEEYY